MAVCCVAVATVVVAVAVNGAADVLVKDLHHTQVDDQTSSGGDEHHQTCSHRNNRDNSPFATTLPTHYTILVTHANITTA